MKGVWQMASAVMHLYVGMKIAKQWQFLDLPQFYLGCIAPDSVNVSYTKATKETRWAAHMRATTKDEWCDNNKNFYDKNIKRLPHSLLVGYITHNITDAMFDEYCLPYMTAELSKMNVQSLTGWGPRWDDCFRFDYDAVNMPWYVSEVLPALKAATPIDINGISREDIEYFNKETIDQYGPKQVGEGNPKVITEKMMDELADKVLEFMSGFVIVKQC